MKKKLLALLIGYTLVMSCVGCGTTYQEATGQVKTNYDDWGGEYFTIITEWGGMASGTYRIVYANDTKVKYFMFSRGYVGGISPLYNADGSLQVYKE